MKTFILLSAMTILVTGAFAQKPAKQVAKPIKSGVMKKGGKIWVVKPMDANVKLDNGLLVLKDGDVRKKNGRTVKLNEGDCLSKDGRVVALDDKSMESGVMKHKTMWVLNLVDKPVVLDNGTTISPDGIVKTKDGKVIPLKNDEIVDLDSDN